MHTTDSSARIGIIGLGVYLPEKILTNADLEKMIDTSDEWIKTRTGISQRRIASPEMAASDLAAYAATAAIKNARIKKEDIGLIIVATITPDTMLPSTACFVQAKLGIKDAACYDLNAACSGFIFALVSASQYVAQNNSKYALIIASEVLSRVVDWQDRSTCVLFGDGAGAAIVGRLKHGGILSSYMGSDGTHADLLKIPAGGSRIPITHKVLDEKLNFIKMEGNEVFKLAVNSMASAAGKVLTQAGLTSSDIDLIIPHQANTRIIYATLKKLHMSKERAFLNIEKYGNMSSASIAVALYEAVKSGKLKKGNKVLLVSFGGGLTWGAVILEW
ncbi:MAG: beta-ketoacyl-ACP synthase III [Candidatus Omnitrophota bacterium]